LKGKLQNQEKKGDHGASRQLRDAFGLEEDKEAPAS